MANMHVSVEIPIIDAPSSSPKGSILHNSKPTCFSMPCHFPASQLEWSFLLYCVLLKPQAWLPGCKPTSLGDLTPQQQPERKPAYNGNAALRLGAELQGHGEACTTHSLQACNAPIECAAHCGALKHSRPFYKVLEVYIYKTGQWVNSTNHTLSEIRVHLFLFWDKNSLMLPERAEIFLLSTFWSYRWNLWKGF